MRLFRNLSSDLIVSVFPVGFLQFIHTLENQREFSARAKVYFASLLTVALHGKLEYYTDIMRTLFLELMEQYVVAKNPKLMLRRFE